MSIPEAPRGPPRRTPVKMGRGGGPSPGEREESGRVGVGGREAVAWRVPS